MTNELLACAGARPPLGSAVFEKSRIERYFASLVVAELRTTDLLRCIDNATGARARSVHCLVVVRRVFVGTSGWVYAGWRDHLYADTPMRRWLEVASRTF